MNLFGIKTPNNFFHSVWKYEIDFILGKENKKFDYSELRKKLLYLMIDQNVRNFFNLELIV